MNQMNNNRIFDELKATVIISSFFGVIVLLFYLVQTTNILKYLSIAIFLLIIMYFISNYLSARKESKYLGFINLVLAYPFVIFVSFLIFTSSYSKLLYAFLLYICFSVLIPLAFFEFISFFFKVSLNEPATFYLKITFTVFFSVLFNSVLRSTVLFISPWAKRSSADRTILSFIDSVNYLLSSANVRMVIYIVYVLAILTISIYKFQGNSLSNSATTDTAILDSFVTFIAFDAALALIKKNDFRPSLLLKKINIIIGAEINKLTNDNVRN